MTVHTINPANVEDERAPHVLVARYRKARAIARVLIALGADTDAALTIGASEAGRTLAANAASQHVPSEVTWALVVEMVGEVRP